MTPRQLELVQSSWASVEPIAEGAAEIFYSLDGNARALVASA